MYSRSYEKLVRLISNIHFMIQTETRKFNRDFLQFKHLDSIIKYSKIDRQHESIQIGDLCLHIFKPNTYSTKLEVLHAATKVFESDIQTAYTSNITVTNFITGSWLKLLLELDKSLKTNPLLVIPLMDTNLDCAS